MSGDRTPSDSERDSHDFRDVVVVGGGVAGLSTAVFTARQGLDTLVIDDGGSLLRRNAHLENFPGFPLGVDARRLLDLLAEQAATAGADRFDGRATRVAAVGEGESVETGGDEAVDDARFVVEVDGDDADDPSDPSDPTRTRHVVAATKNEVGYLEGVEGVGILDRGKSYVDTDERGRTGASTGCTRPAGSRRSRIRPRCARATAPRSA